jgi:DNA-binding transcriptional MocR family regulator
VIAQVLGRSHRSVRTAQYCALQRLRTLFGRGVAWEAPKGYVLTWAIQPEETEIESLTTVVLSDGRVAAQIAPIHNPAEFLIFTEEDGHWVTDEAYIVVDAYNFGPQG